MTEGKDDAVPRKRRGRLVLLVLGGLLLMLVALAVALPYVASRWGHDCHRVEPTEGLDRIKNGARYFYETVRHDSNGDQLPRRFPRSTPPTPAKPRCEKATTPEALWNIMPGWKELKFAITEPHYYSFQFLSAGTGAAAVFTARATGDLDCDGELSTFELRGSVDRDGTVKVVGPVIWNEIE